MIGFSLEEDWALAPNSYWADCPKDIWQIWADSYDSL